MGFIYATTNLLDVSSLHSVSSEDTLYVKENLYCQRPSKPFYFTSKLNQWVKLNFAAAPQRITLVAAFNHNLTAAADCHVQGNAADAWPGTDVGHVPWRLYDKYLRFDQTFAWWRFWVDDPTNPVNPRIGELFFGQWTAFPNAYVQPGREDGSTFFAVEQQTSYGQDWDVYLSEAERFKITLANINDSATLDAVQQFLTAIAGPAGRFVFIPDPAKPHVYFVKVVGSPSASRPIYGPKELRNWSIELKALTRGITLL